jgi:RHS repeat-associated protein
VLNDTVHSYTYDAENRVTQLDGTPGTCSTATACYIYGADGLRAQETVGGTITSYTRDLVGRVIAEIQNSGWQVGYVYAGGLTAIYEGSTTYFVHPDHLGSTRLMTAVNQSIYDSTDFMPFGEQILGDTGTTHKFMGYPRDSESDLDYAMNRYYSSRQGRFMSPDPYNAGANPMNPQSWNGYAYALNNPLSLIDPFGLDPFACSFDDGTIWDSEEDEPDLSPDEFAELCEMAGGTVQDLQVNTTVVVNGSDEPNSGGYGTGSPPPGCAFYYQNGIFEGTSCGNGLPQNVLQSQKLGVAVANGVSLAGYAIPAPCGGGAFVFAGGEGENGAVGYLGEYDTNVGFSNNVFAEGSSPTTGAGGGAFTNGSNGVNPFVFVPAGEAGGVVAFKGGVGLYVGGSAGPAGAGAGVYLNITSASTCQ